MPGEMNLRDGAVAAGLAFVALFALLAPQALTWLPAALAVVMLLVWPEQPSSGQPFDAVRIHAAPVLLLLAMLAWVLFRNGLAPSPAAGWMPLGAFAFCLLSVVVTLLLTVRMGFNGRWFWSYFLCLHAVFQAVLLLFVWRWLDLSAIGGSRLTMVWHFNRAAVLAVLLLPLSFFAIRQMARSWRQCLLWSVPLYALTGLVVFASESQSAQLSFFLISLVQALALINLNLAVKVTGLGAALVVMFTPLVFGRAYGWFRESFLWDLNQGTVTERMLIWRSMLDFIWQSPWIGNGIEFVREVGNVNPETGAMMRPNHPHSFVFQVWVDTGLVGAAVLSLLILSIARMIRSIGGASGQMFITLMAGILAVWAVSHGMWQSWFVGMAGLCCTYGAFMHQRSALLARIGLVRDT